MQKKLTLEDIAKLRSNYKDDFVLQGLLSALEPRVRDGEEIIWHNPPIDPIPPRPWKVYDLGFAAADGLNIGLDSYGALSEREKMALAQFIVDRVNAGESNGWEEIKATYEKTFSQAHSILDSMGVPKAERAECNRSDCDSLLIHRLHTFRDSFGYQFTPEARNATKTNCHQIAPCQPTENQYVSMRHVLDTLCALCAETVRDIFEYRQATDCFCGQNPQRHADDYRFSSAVLRFITDAVREKIAAVRQKWPIQWPTPE